VALVGSFNGWNADADVLAQVADGFWAVEKRLNPGTHYYQYLVDGVKICDPYAREVLWPQGGISNPDPPQAVLKIGGTPYQWRSDGWQRPAFRDLIIYETHVADFTPEGTFAAMAAKLDYIKDLGVNAIEMMPVTEDTFDKEWGYQPTYFFAVNHDYGTADDLKRLIDEAHTRRLAVILDIVLAHTSPAHSFNKLYKFEESPWYGRGIGGTNEFGLPTFDHHKEPVRAFCRDVQAYWFKEFQADGIRYDYAINIGIDGQYGMPYLGKEARTVRSDAYLIGEYVPEDPKAVGLTEFNANWHGRFSYAMKAFLLQKEMNKYDWNQFDEAVRVFDPAREGYSAASHMVNYVESHDEFRLLYELRTAGIERTDARYRASLAGTLLMTAPGVPMLYHGQEFGEIAHLSRNERVPLRWELLSTLGGKGLFSHYLKVIALRNQHPGLRAEGYALVAVHKDEKWVVFRRWNEEGDEILVAANVSEHPHNVTIPFPRKGAWHDVIRDVRVEVANDGDSVVQELKGYEGAVFVKA